MLDSSAENLQQGIASPAVNEYLNDFHRRHTEQLKMNLAKQPKATLQEALAQYARIKRQSQRRKP